MYIDESGDDGFSHDGSYKPGATPTPFFTRSAIILHDWKWQTIVNEIRAFRLKYQMPASEEIHATKILNGRSKAYLKDGQRISPPNFFGLKWPDKTERRELLLNLCRMIAGLEITLIGIAISKAKINISRPDYRKYPKDFSWELLIERVNYFLSQAQDKRGMMISDAVEINLEKYHRAFTKALIASSMHIKQFHFIETLLFEPSDSSDLLQITDVVSFAVGRKFNCGDDSFFKILEPIFFSRNGVLNGIGLKQWP